jgi:hypothetical protein
MGLPSRKEEIDLRRLRRFRARLLKLFAVLVAGALIIISSSYLIQRELKIQFDAGRIDAEVLEATGISYRDKVKASMGTYDKLFLVLYSESPNNIFLFVNWISTRPEITVNITGKYVEVLNQNGYIDVVYSSPTFDIEGRCPLFPTADIKGYCPLLQYKMIWGYPEEGVTGCGALELSFSFSIGGLKTGGHDVDIQFKLVEF